MLVIRVRKCTMKWYILISLMSLAGSLTAYGSYKTQSYPTIPTQSDQMSYCLMGNEWVCGTNGYENFLFENQCAFSDFNGKQLRAGQWILNKTELNDCYPSKSYSNPSGYCPQYCNQVNQPVCGSYLNVQRNFTNQCEMRRYMCEKNENWQLVSNGTCVTATCAPEAQEICAIFENHMQQFENLDSLYDNIQATGKNWQILNVGPCPCPLDYKPICAKVNCTTRTYQNECFFQRDIQTATYWSILFHGECPLIPSPCNNNGTDNDLATPSPLVNSTSTITPNVTVVTESSNATETISIITNNSTTTTTTPSTATVDPGSALPDAAMPPPLPGSALPPGSAPGSDITAGCNNTNAITYKRPVYIVKQNYIIPYGPQYDKPKNSTYGTYSYGPSKSVASYDSSGYSSSSGNEGSYSPAYIPYSSSYSGSYEDSKSQDSANIAPYGPANANYGSSYSGTYNKAPQTEYAAQKSGCYNKPAEVKSYVKQESYSPIASYNSAYKKPSPAQSPGCGESYIPAPVPASYSVSYKKPGEAQISYIKEESYGPVNKEYTSSSGGSYNKPQPKQSYSSASSYRDSYQKFNPSPSYNNYPKKEPAETHITYMKKESYGPVNKEYPSSSSGSYNKPQPKQSNSPASSYKAPPSSAVSEYSNSYARTNKQYKIVYTNTNYKTQHSSKYNNRVYKSDDDDDSSYETFT